MTKAALDHLGPGSAIVNTTSITAYQGYPKMVDYSATRGAIVAFTRSMAGAMVDKGIRVNAVAQGPIWTPPSPAYFDAEQVRNNRTTEERSAGEEGARTDKFRGG